MQQKPQQTRDIFMSAFGIGSQLGILAYSRQHELEADKLGLVFMAMAGYNPERSVSFWKEMEVIGGTKPPELLSTHPSDQHRIAQIESFLPVAMKYYQPVYGSSGNNVLTLATTVTPSKTATKTSTPPASTTPPNPPSAKPGVRIK